MLSAGRHETALDHLARAATTRREMDWRLDSGQEDSIEKRFYGGLKGLILVLGKRTLRLDNDIYFMDDA
jgi:hypothetical protein